MKSELNLYLDEFRPRALPWSATWLAGALLLTALIIAAHALLLFNTVRTTRALIAQEEQIRNELQSTIAQLKRLVPDEAALRRFENERATLLAQIDARERYLQYLGHIADPRAKQPPSGYVAAIAAAHIDGLWLSKLELSCCNAANRPELLLHGYTQSDKLLPNYLDALAAQPLLKGFAFPTFTVARPDSQQHNATKLPESVLEFTLTSRRSDTTPAASGGRR